MLPFGSLVFGSPWLLVGLAALPVLWWLLRFTPPAPRAERFPAIALLLRLAPSREDPQRMPRWLLALRILLAGLIIFAFADPVLRAAGVSLRSAPLVIAIDDGDAAAGDFEARRAAFISLAEEADRNNMPVVIVTTAPRASLPGIERLSGKDARARLAALTPVPWEVDRGDAAKRLDEAKIGGGYKVVWISDGLDHPGTNEFHAALERAGTLTVTVPQITALPLVLLPPREDGAVLVARVRRAQSAARIDTQGTVRASAADGRELGEATFVFAPGASEAEARFDLPLGLRNDITRLEIEGQRHAGAVVLLDESSRRRSVGLVSGAVRTENQPLLSDLYFLERALKPYAALTRGSISALATQDRAIVVLADVGQILGEDHDTLKRWVEKGGTLVRFAGPRMAAQSDDLIPVTLRRGGRTFGGTLTWESPQGMGTFAQGSPFAGLTPSQDVKVKRQVLAEPAPDLGEKTWAQLADGTPLVTADRRGEGLLVLIHVTANTDWSDLPLSGLFVEMMRRVIALSHGQAAAAARGSSGMAALDGLLAPYRLLDAFGVLAAPPEGVRPLDAAKDMSKPAGPDHPPGFYGPADTPAAFNLTREDTVLASLSLPGTANLATLTAHHSRALKPVLLVCAFIVALADCLAVLFLRGVGLRGLASGARRAAAMCLIAGLACAVPPPAHAQESSASVDDFAMEALKDFRLAYVRTGDPQVDTICEAGLRGLSQTLRDRTAVEPAPPMGVDLEQDEVVFFPLLYWQVTSDQPDLSDAAIAKLDKFMKSGGTLIVDTADEDEALVGGGEGGLAQQRLRAILGHLDLPALEPIGPDHVLTKAFYLVQDFPGRWVGGKVWAETAAGGADHDGVASLIIGSNDWAGAWAMDETGHWLLPTVPGGDRQREMALRVGVNLVMYVLTGNYKADQVHVPALLERLGQ